MIKIRCRIYEPEHLAAGPQVLRQGSRQLQPVVRRPPIFLALSESVQWAIRQQ
mgnify:CR=1 FL=1